MEIACHPVEKRDPVLFCHPVEKRDLVLFCHPELDSGSRVKEHNPVFQLSLE